MASITAHVARKSFRELHGVVVSAGLMRRTVKVRVGKQSWNNFMQKFFNTPETHLVHDPNDSLRTGDVVAITPGWRTSKKKRHVVKRIIAPAQVPVEERPAVPTEQERWAAEDARKQAKDERRALRKQIEHAKTTILRTAALMVRTQRQLTLRNGGVDKNMAVAPYGKDWHAKLTSYLDSV